MGFSPLTDHFKNGPSLTDIAIRSCRSINLEGRLFAATFRTSDSAGSRCA